MKRRQLHTTFASGLALSLAGCLGNRSQTSPKSDGDVGSQPPATLRMSAVTDLEIAQRATYRVDLDHRESERQLAISVIDNGAATINATNRPFPENRAFVYDESVYELSYEVVDADQAVRFRVTLDAVEGDISDDETIRYDELPDIDKATLEQYGWGNPEAFEVAGVPIVYLEDEIPDSVVVPEPEYPVIVWDSKTRGRVTIGSPEDIEVEAYKYTAREVHGSAEQFGRDIREEHEFTLSDLSEGEETIVSESITAEHGYVAPKEEPLPDAFNRLVERFSQQDDVNRVYEETDEDDSSESGWYVVTYEGEVHWVELFVRDETGGTPDS